MTDYEYFKLKHFWLTKLTQVNPMFHHAKELVDLRDELEKALKEHEIKMQEAQKEKPW